MTMKGPKNYFSLIKSNTNFFPLEFINVSVHFTGCDSLN